jgi:hypothetical protein
MARVKGESQEVRETADQIKLILQKLIDQDKEMVQMAKKLDFYANDGSADELKDVATRVAKQLKSSIEPCYEVCKNLREYADFLERL